MSKVFYTILSITISVNVFSQVQLIGKIQGDTICSKVAASKVSVVGFENNCDSLQIIYENQSLPAQECWFYLYDLPLGASDLTVKHNGMTIGTISVVKLEPFTHVYLKVGEKIMEEGTIAWNDLEEIEKLVFVEECPLVKSRLKSFVFAAAYNDGQDGKDYMITEAIIPPSIIQEIKNLPRLIRLYVDDIRIYRGLSCESSGNAIGSLVFDIKQ
ncbi:MAG TPA: hypothetical protein PKA00_00865 [Saprospiraceae bacterium]|nr:hypothetical protein [Saprospiraceae bacterium]HMQ81417.1 hypothetical protein [Saprospiraceae bacterium]